MSEQNYLIEEDLKEAEAMLKGFEAYLESNEVYGKVGGGGIFGGGSMPALTAGALVMRLRRLGAQRDQMTPNQQTRLDTAQNSFEAITKEWHVHYENKLLREANSRLDAMRMFFQEARESPPSANGLYKPELLRRTIAQEIIGALKALGVSNSELENKAKQTDSHLRGIANQPTTFLWDRSLEAYYPEKDYWWLYRRPRD